MRAFVQRVAKSSVMIEGESVGAIGRGLNCLLGISTLDGEKEAQYLAQKVVNLRVFEDEAGKMNRSLLDVGGELLVISQFTLLADCRKGNRPSFIGAARPEQAVPLYELFVSEVRRLGVKKVETGRFGADMQVFIHNDGPVSILIDTEQKVLG